MNAGLYNKVHLDKALNLFFHLWPCYLRNMERGGEICVLSFNLVFKFIYEKFEEIAWHGKQSSHGVVRI